MAKDCQQPQTPPGQSVAASSIHSSAGDLGITIKLDIVKVMCTNILTVTYSKSRGEKRSVEDANIQERNINSKCQNHTRHTIKHSNEVIRRKHKQ